MKKLVYGVGVNDRPKTKGTIEYDIWINMLSRCYSSEFHKRQPTYINCSVSDNFKSLSYFYDWCQNQIGFGNNGWHLDKDILVKGNKIYSEDTCVFIPQEINKILEKRNAMRGELPIGVSIHKTSNTIRATISINGKQNYLGSFDCPISAFNAYKKAKEDYIKLVAIRNKEEIDPRAFSSLMSYQISIDD